VDHGQQATGLRRTRPGLRVEITLYGDEEWAEIAISDDGVGGARMEARSGLRGLCDRVDALGGRLTLASASGHGTTVRARVPIANEGRDPIAQLL